jgi:molecular chaperone GrpE (heat shock protein)
MYRVMSQSVQKNKNTEAEETVIEVPVSNSVQEFDYSTVDEETASFLQEKVQRVNDIRIKSVIAIGKELKEAQERLSNHYQGCFGKWVESIGFSRQTAQNYIQGYEWVVKNFDNIIDAEKIQPSLLFAISKPSAPKELQQAVLNGDIATHKQYKELEAKLKAEEGRRKAAEKELEEETKLRQKAERHAEKIANMKNNLEEQNRKLLNERNELEKKLEELKSRPIEVAVQEVIPEDIKRKLEKYEFVISGQEKQKQIQADFKVVEAVLNSVFQLTDVQVANFLLQYSKIKDEQTREAYTAMIKAVSTKVVDIEYSLTEYEFQDPGEEIVEEIEVRHTCQMCGKADPTVQADDGEIFCTILDYAVERDNPNTVCGHFIHFADMEG